MAATECGVASVYNITGIKPFRKDLGWRILRCCMAAVIHVGSPRRMSAARKIGSRRLYKIQVVQNCISPDSLAIEVGAVAGGA